LIFGPEPHPLGALRLEERSLQHVLVRAKGGGVNENNVEIKDELSFSAACGTLRASLALFI